jgi:hypothetical protein
MGIFTDIFIASEAEVADTSFATASPAERFPALMGKNIDPVALANLSAALRGADGTPLEQDALEIDEVNDVVRDIGAEDGGPEGEQWIYRIPATLIQQIVTLPTADVSRAGAAWANTFWRRTPTPTPDFVAGIVAYLEQLRQIAVRARSEEKMLFLWISM